MRLLKFREKQAVIHSPLPLLRIFLAALLLCQASASAFAVQVEFWQDVTEEAAFFEDGTETGDTFDSPTDQISKVDGVISPIARLSWAKSSLNDKIVARQSHSRPHATGPPLLCI